MSTTKTKSRIRKETKHCPYCAEMIRYEAVKCRFCGEFLYGDRRNSIPEDPEELYEETDRDEDEDEEILYWGRPSIFLIPKTLVTCALLLCAAWMFTKFPVVDLVEQTPGLEIPRAEALVIEQKVHKGALVFGGVVLLVLMGKIGALKTTYYEVTPDRIEYARGILKRKVDNLDMFRVIDLKMDRTLFDTVVGIGTVTLITRDETDPNFKFEKIRGARYLYNTIKKASLEADRQRGVIHLE